MAVAMSAHTSIFTIIVPFFSTERRDTIVLRPVKALGSSGDTHVWIAAVMRFSVPPFFHAERKETDARAGGDCYTFKSPGSVIQQQTTFLFLIFFLSLESLELG